MKKLVIAVLGASLLSAGLSLAPAPAFALGACGRNGHRDPWGHCVWGGQNQAWCERQTGHPAGYGPNGTRWCR